MYDYPRPATPEEFAQKAWQAACLANFIGGCIEVPPYPLPHHVSTLPPRSPHHHTPTLPLASLPQVAGIILAEPLRRNLPKAALYGPICGVGFVWLGFNPLIDVMREPLIGFLPLALCFTGFFAVRGAGVYTRKLPTAFLIFGVGTILWWLGLARWDTQTATASTAT